MEEPDKGSPASDDRSQKTAAALRALRAGLGSKLENHRRRTSDIEVDLTAKVLEVAEELARDEASPLNAQSSRDDDQVRKLRDTLRERDETIAKLQRQVSDIELSQLRMSAELTESRSSMGAIRGKACSDCEDLRNQLAIANEKAIEFDSTNRHLQEQMLELEGVLENTHRTLEEMREAEKSECDRLRNELAEQYQQAEVAAERDREWEAKVEALTQELDQARDAEIKLHAKHTAECDTYVKSQIAAAQVQQSLTERTAELMAATEREAQANEQIESLLKQIESLGAELATARDVAAQLHAQNAVSDTTLGQAQSSAAEAQRLLEERSAQLAEVTDRESQANARVEALEQQLQALSADLMTTRDAEARLLAERSAGDLTLTEAQAAVADTQQQLAETIRHAEELTAQVEALGQELAQARTDLAAKDESASNELSWLQKEQATIEQSRQQLSSDFEELLKKQKATEEALAEVELKYEQAAATTQQAEEQVAALTASSADEVEQANKKFELALADAQKLKRENAELQDELARRPEVDDAESPELVSLRVERDALAAKITELEAAPRATVDEDSEERIADLQRRFEMAVEDVRQLKQDNAQLQEKLAQAPQGGKASPAGGNQAMDWQAQKARLLAELDAEDDTDQTSERREELVTIAGTISITDQVVAEKDREITKLREQLAERPIEVVEKAIELEFLEKDELIAAEREKLEALQKEWHEKLRGAELEMSVQRATLARKEAEVEQKLKSAREAEADPAVDADGKPRRRWLSALGLRDDEEKDGKK